jgi:hypothetical protein
VGGQQGTFSHFNTFVKVWHFNRKLQGDPMGDCLLWAFKKTTEADKNVGLLFSRV